ncbi:MAG TPA: shikimate dehydrogenase [Pyrinomonadaceae bacterium]
MEASKAKICVPVCAATNEWIHSMARAAEIGDLLELRLDCLPKEKRESAWREFVASTDRTIILTLRPAEQGGEANVLRADRLQFWSSIQNLRDRVMVDLELDVINEALANTDLDSSRVICSHHQFEGEIANPEGLYERMAAQPAAVLKIAVRADDAIDCLPIFKLLERAQRDRRELIAIAMGQAGVMTRILGPSRGSFLTFGALDDETATAPGQLTARQLRDVYRIDRINRQTQIMGLIGNPVAHSMSPRIHNAAFAKSNANAVFIPFEVHDLDGFMRRMVRRATREIDWNVRGLSVTAPHKASVMKHLNWIEPGAKEIGAVNTIVVQDDALHGYNTDAPAFIKTLRGRVDQLENLRCAVIGAGGAARGVVWALKNAGASVRVFARNKTKASSIGDDFQIAINELAQANFKDSDVIVNATPLGTLGAHQSDTAVVAAQLRGVRWAYDLVYNPLETRFMREAKAAGCETIGGLEMLIAQAVGQFKLWTGAVPDVDTMRAAAEKALGTISTS